MRAVGRDNGQTLQRQLLFFIQLRLGAEIRPLIMQALPVRAGGKLQLAGIALPGNERQVIKGEIQRRQLPLQLIERQRRAVGVAARQF